MLEMKKSNGLLNIFKSSIPKTRKTWCHAQINPEINDYAEKENLQSDSLSSEQLAESMSREF
jgi:hypothetical protein